MGFGGSVRTVSVRLAAEIAGYVTNMRQAGQATKAFSAELGTLAETSKTKFNDVTRTGLVTGGLLAAVFIGAAKAASDFDHQMSAVSSVMDKQGKSAQQVAQELGDLRQAAIVAGRDTVFSATEAAQAEEELAKAGVSTADILGGGLTGALSLASAGAIDLADAATITAKALNTFELQGSATAHVADVLTAAANTSATDVKDMGLALSQVGNVAHDIGLSLEDTTGVLALFAQKGLTSSDAGTSFKTMLQSLHPTSSKTIGLMQQLGLSFDDAQGKFIGISATAQMLHDKLGVLSDAERQTALNQIFGSDAARAADIIYRQGAQGIQQWISGVNQSGIASKTAAERMNNLQGDLEQLRGSLETLAISSGEGATGGLRHLTQAATGTVNAFMDMPGWLQQTIVDLSGLSGGSILAVTGLVKVKGSLKETKAALEGMGPAGSKASKALSGLTKWGGYAAIAGVAVFGIVELFKAIGAASKPAKMDLDGVTDSLSNFALVGQATGDLGKRFGGDLSGVTKAVQDLAAARADLSLQQSLPQRTTNFGKGGAAPSDAFENAQKDQAKIDELTQSLGSLDAGLAQQVKNGNVTAAANTFQYLRTQIAGTGIDINTVLPQYSDEARKVAAANVGVAKGFASVSEQTKIMTDGLHDAIEHGKTLETVFKELNGATINSTQKTIDYKNSLAVLAATVEKNKKEHDKYATSLSMNTQTGRDNVSMILDSINKANAASEATLEQTGSVDKANAVWAANIKLLKEQLHQLGFTPKQIQSIIDTYAKMPPVVSTKVVAPGLMEANSTATGYRKLMDEMDGKKVTTYFDANGLAAANDTATGYKAIMDNLNGRRVTTKVLTKYETDGTIPPSSNWHGHRWGGAYEHAAVGLLSEASMYTTASPGRYMIAEPETGGEGFVPRYGNYARSTAIIDQEAKWYGGRFVPNTSNGWSGGGGSSYSPSVTYAIYPQEANFSVMHLQALQASHDAQLRVRRRS